METLIWIASLVIVVFIHEFGHYAAARLWRVRVKEVQVFFFPIIKYTPDVTPSTPLNSWRRTRWVLGLLPFGGVTLFDPYQYGALQPFKRLVISLAGIAFNIATWIVIMLLDVTVGVSPFIYYVGMVSGYLALLNVIPVYPLDGGAALLELYEIITGRQPSAQFRQVLAGIGTVLIILFFWIIPLLG